MLQSKAIYRTVVTLPHEHTLDLQSITKPWSKSLHIVLDASVASWQYNRYNEPFTASPRHRGTDGARTAQFLTRHLVLIQITKQ